MRPLIYTPSGRAGEYADHGYAANQYRGCSHGCLYCNVPSELHMDKGVFHAETAPAPFVLERLERDMKRVGKLPEPVFLCFTCDPYFGKGPFGYGDITRDAIDIIVKSGNRVNILTKGGKRAIKDFGVLERSRSMIGATLTFYSDIYSREWEPCAALPESRILMLEQAKACGIETWASIEPVIVPQQSLMIMERAAPYVDIFKIGKWNHDKRANEIDWRKFAKDAVTLCEKYGKKWLLKKDLIEACR